MNALYNTRRERSLRCYWTRTSQRFTRAEKRALPPNLLLELVLPSVSMLRDKCERFFSEQVQSTPAFPLQNFDWRWPAAKLIDVVLIGNPLTVLVDSENWPWTANFRLWVLCSAGRRIVTDAFGLAEDEVGIVPRYALFPTERELANFPDPTSEFDLVYSGRTTRDKSFHVTFEVARRLQRIWPGTVPDFKICHPAFSPPAPRIAIAAKTGWLKSPRWLGDLGFDWSARGDWRNPVLIQLSISPMEDFGVSVAQAQASGMPVIVSDWGAHRDVQGKCVIKIPPRWIADRRIGKIADEIISQLQSTSIKGDAASRPEVIWKLPKAINHRRLAEGRRMLLEKFPSCIDEKLFIYRHLSGDSKRALGRAGR